MFFKRKLVKSLNESITKLNNNLIKYNMHELIYILGSKKEILTRNIIAGLARGVGIGIGVTIITAIIVYLLQKVVKLNIPIISEYIIDIINIVEQRR